MSRLAAAIVAAALALIALVGLPIAGGGSQPTKAAAAECVWKRVTKRVVKHVRRHGKVRKVVRKRHRWVCRPVAPAPAVVAPPAPAPPTPPAPPAPEEEANRLAVKADEFYFVLSQPSVRAGELTVELNNQGEDPHDLNIRAEGDEGTPLQIPETDSLQRRVADFELPAGKYRLWCSLPEHDGKGMHATLLVG